MAEENESTLTGYPNVISYECTKKILTQMEKSICQIDIGQEQGTGFFCKIPFPDKNYMLPVFITNNHVINKDILYKKDIKIKINIKEENEVKLIDLKDRIKYTNEEYDITIIEIKEKKDNIKKYLKLDSNIINNIINNNNNNNKDYNKKTVYIPQYPDGELSVSYGVLISEDKEYNFKHKCITKGGSSGSPVLNLKNKLIGIHKKGIYNKYNIGTFLNYPIRDFIKINYNNNINKINIINENINKNSDTKENQMLIQDFEKKYDLYISNTKIGGGIFRHKEIGNEGFEDLCKMDLKDLKILDLEYNNISNITPLKLANFEKLEKLSFSFNKISDINILEKVNFKELKELDLYENDISDITVLKNVKFEKLEKLDLRKNKIEDISILKEVYFRKLKDLYLGENKISDISVLEEVKFEDLETLSLKDNKISNINILANANFKKLKYLSLDQME